VSAYDEDPRVDWRGDGTYHVELPGDGRPGSIDGYVIPIDGGTRFVAYIGLLDSEPEGWGFDTADEAIRSLIGEPK